MTWDLVNHAGACSVQRQWHAAAANQALQQAGTAADFH